MLADDLPVIGMTKRNQTSTAGCCYVLSLLTFSALWLLILFSRMRHMHDLPKPTHKAVVTTTATAPTLPKYPSPHDAETYFEHIDHLVRPYSYFRVVDRLYAGSRPARAPKSLAERAAFRWMIDDYLTFHKRNRYNASRYLVYVPTCVGMGDQTDLMLSAYVSAVLSRRVLLVDWKHPFWLSELLTRGPVGADLFYDEKRDGSRGISGRDPFEKETPFVVYLNKRTDREKRDERLLLSDVRTVVLKWNGMPRRVSERLLQFDRPETVPIHTVDTMRMSLALRRAVLHRAFRVNNAVLQYRTNLTRTLGLCAGMACAEGRPAAGDTGIPYIGVHARLGEGVGEGMDRFTEIARQQRRAAKCLASRAVRLAMTEAATVGMSSPLRVFLATDTPAFRSEFRIALQEMGGGRIGFASGDWVTMHSKKIPDILDDNTVRPPRVVEAMWGSYADLTIMGGARHIVALRSGFARLALLLGEAETLTELRNDVCLKLDKWP